MTDLVDGAILVLTEADNLCSKPYDAKVPVTMLPLEEEWFLVGELGRNRKADIRRLAIPINHRCQPVVISQMLHPRKLGS